MAFPICDTCASSGVLCPECERRVREGEISELDVIVSTLLWRRKVRGYDSLVNLGDKIVIFAPDEEAPKIIGQGGVTAAELSRKLGRRVVVLPKGADKDLIIKSLARPSRLVAKNKIFKPGGGEKLKLIFDKPLDESTVELMKKLVGEVEIEYGRR